MSAPKRPARAPRAVVPNDALQVCHAIERLRSARALLRFAGATRAAAYVSRALKSADGARRHAEGLLSRAPRAEGGAR